MANRSHPGEIIQGVLRQARIEVTNRNEQDELRKLRDLLLKEEQSELDQLKSQLNSLELSSEELSEILPEAILISNRKNNRLKEALAPSTIEAIRAIIRQDPKYFSDAIYPVMGPAIRKSVLNSLRSMVESINEVLANSLSLRGLQWRWQAMRTGKSFAEVALVNSLLYRVEQVFLIHRETGLLLKNVVAPRIEMEHPEMVSGMLTAIQDFVRDSFGPNTQGTLEKLQVGELNVWIEQGPRAYLAAVIRGNAPHDLRIVLQNTLERIHLDHGHSMKAFSGDATPFEATRQMLASCLLVQTSTPRKKKPYLAWGGLGLIGTLMLGWLGFVGWQNWQWDSYLENLNNAPGLVITRTDTENGKQVLYGLRDPLAPPAASYVGNSGVDPDDIVERLEPYLSFSPQFVTARARQFLNAPESISFSYANGTLFLHGRASNEWLESARDAAAFIPGVSAINEEGMIASESSRMMDLKIEIEKTTIRFSRGRLLLDGQEELVQEIVTKLNGLEQLAKKTGKTTRINILGHSDSIGSERINNNISRQRAEFVQNMLKLRGITSENIVISGLGTQRLSEFAEDNTEANRRVTFEVIIE